MLSFRSIVLAAAILTATVIAAHADKRVALVIGNSAYRNVAKLKNPGNDAAAVVAMFNNAGFDFVDSRLDLSVVDMRRALREFGNKARDADMAVIYYAGHGIELDGTNYLIPVDATLETDTDVLDETFPLDRVLFAIEPARQLRLVILDACRDNPFAKSMKRTVGSRSIGRGLARVEPSSPNTMIAFAAKAGSTASDGDSRNSPFASSLVQHLAKPGLDVRRAFGFVRDDVLKATNNTQEPFVYGSLGGNDVALVPAASVAAPVDRDAAMRRDYEFAERVGSRPVWDAFIERYPSGFFTALAHEQRNKFAAENVQAAEKPRVAAEPVTKAEEAKVTEAERLKVAKGSKAGAETGTAAETPGENRVAALSANADKPGQTAPSDIPRLLQAELRRVGCRAEPADGNWNRASQRSLETFNKFSGMKLDVKVASVDAFDAVRSKTDRICPPACDHGYKADGNSCTKITCRSGHEVGDDNTCEKIRAKKPSAKREEPNSRGDGAARAKSEDRSAKPQVSGQIFCNAQGCRPLAKGCRIEWSSNATGKSTSTQYQVCN